MWLEGGVRDSDPCLGIKSERVPIMKWARSTMVEQDLSSSRSWVPFLAYPIFNIVLELGVKALGMVNRRPKPNCGLQKVDRNPHLLIWH